eukprot:TRINITY_DN21400_c1_g1_i1.p1 TRINITY_DN21400_c1_g1~~TRINITY_DN21400_c1_g1_i1.p1  ORF type:complete len:513 (-),score=128.66 TRINITY_DN21400_c1_g1_i1:174-1712(-)
MGSDVSICERGKAATQARLEESLPTMALVIEAFAAAASTQESTGDAHQEYLASVLVDGAEVPGGRLMRIPTPPVEVTPRGSSTLLRIAIYSRELPPLTRSFPGASKDRRAGPLQSLADVEGVQLRAELSVPLAGFAHYGAPLYSSLWLGLEEPGVAAQAGAQGVAHALRRSRMPGAAKAKITLVRPALPTQAVSRVEPNVKALFQDLLFGQIDDFDAESRIAQVNGLIRCIDECNAALGAHEEEQGRQAAVVRGFQGVLESMDSKRKQLQSTQQRLQSLREERSLRRSSSAFASTTASADSAAATPARRAGAVSDAAPKRTAHALLKDNLNRIHEAVLRRKSSFGVKDGEGSPTSSRGADQAARDGAGGALNTSVSLRRPGVRDETEPEPEEALRRPLATSPDLGQAGRGQQQRAGLPGTAPDLRIAAALADEETKWLRELERLELLLVEERRRSAALEEEKRSQEAAYQRDIAALEEMLEGVLEQLSQRTMSDLQAEKLRLAEAETLSRWR